MSGRMWHRGQGQGRQEGGDLTGRVIQINYISVQTLFCLSSSVTFILTLNLSAPHLYLIYLFFIQILQGHKKSNRFTQLTTVRLLYSVPRVLDLTFRRSIFTSSVSWAWLNAITSLSFCFLICTTRRSKPVSQHKCV